LIPLLALKAEGTNISLPNDDGPPLPEAFVASLNDDANDAIKTAYFHVDKGVTCVVMDQAAKLHCPIPTQATCGTVAKGPCMTINAMGSLVLDFITDTGLMIPLEFPQATPTIASFSVKSKCFFVTLTGTTQQDNSY
jgi:hypothetical protein